LIELISAIICTHNRASFLIKAINSLINQSISKSLYEILVIDNCSTDSTAEIVRKYSAMHKVRYIYEPRLGLSHARNTGWRNARGKYVAYLDDDAIADLIWLEKAIEAFEEIKPMPGCVGGKVMGIWESHRPGWLSDELVTGLTVLDWSNKPLQIHDLNEKWLAGANIAFPIEVLKQVGGFVTGLDRVGNNLISGGDVYIQKQIVKTGHSCIYYPDMSVGHHIPRARLTQEWFIPRYFWQGVSDAIVQIIDKVATPAERIRIAIPLMVKLVRNPRTLSHLIYPGKNPNQFTHKCFAMITLGHILGLLYLAKLEK
jgi:glycosyltransferase involved in cell wall biosynthesis